MKLIYLDNNASTRVDPAVLESMQSAMKNCFGNPHSNDHAAGWATGKLIETARRQISDLISSDANELVFTSGATESNNLAVLGYANGIKPADQKNHIIVSAIEHKCVIEAAKALTRRGWHLSIIPCNSTGFVDIDALAEMLSIKTALVSVIAVNNEIGTIQPLAEIAQLCHRHGAVFHCDAAQAPLAMQLDVNDQGIDMLSLSAHKIHGPQGIGALYIRRDLKSQMSPILHGGGQEDGLRPGTLATPLCVGFGTAAEIANRTTIETTNKVMSLRDKLFSSLSEQNPGCFINGSLAKRHPGNLNVCFPGIDANRLIGKLQPQIAISSGSACTTGIPEPSHVLLAIGLTAEDAESSVRIGLDKFSTNEEIDIASALINKAVEECRSVEA